MRNKMPIPKSQFTSTLDQWRLILGLSDIPDDEYLSIKRNLMDILFRGGKFVTGNIKDISYNSETNTLIIFYDDNETPPKSIVLNNSSGGNTLTTVILDEITKTIIFTFIDGSTIDLNLVPLMDNYYNKEEINMMIKNINSLIWHDF